MQLQLTMSKSEENRTERGSGGFAVQCRRVRGSLSGATALGCVLLLLLFGTAGCRRDMQDQPKMKPYRGTTFFGDGLSSRQPIEGTIPRGYLRDNVAYFTGKKPKSPGTATAAATPAQQQTAAGAQQSTFPDDVDTFPFAVTKEIVARGRERYDIFCSACHGLTGNGDGMIVRRGFRRAASFNDDRLRQAPVGHFFDAITNGWGTMPAYAPQIPVQDRWAIISYIRALQLSQQNTAAASASPAPSPSATPPSGGQQ
jgi:mono/diheme cytochrome c family protein